jgi:hypothetical protein
MRPASGGSTSMTGPWRFGSAFRQTIWPALNTGFIAVRLQSFESSSFRASRRLLRFVSAHRVDFSTDFFAHSD